MSRRTLLFAAIGFTYMSVAVDIASGQSQPRAPLIPGRFEAMLPPFAEVPVPSDAIRIQNFGNVQLGLIYRDGGGGWREAKLDSGKSELISCLKCGSKMSVQFHNGREITKMEIDLGRSYVLRWSEQKKEWELSAPDRLPGLRDLLGRPLT